MLIVWKLAEDCLKFLFGLVFQHYSPLPPGTCVATQNERWLEKISHLQIPTTFFVFAHWCETHWAIKINCLKRRKQNGMLQIQI